MDIESILIREGGTKVEIGTKQYHFLPSAAYGGAHVAEVTEPTHLGILLGIPEGYRVAVKPGDEAASEPAPVQPAVTGRSVDAGAFLAAAAAAADTAAADAEQVETPADETPAAPAEPVAAAAPVDTDRLDGMDHDALVAEFERLEGRKPHHC